MGNKFFLHKHTEPAVSAVPAGTCQICQRNLKVSVKYEPKPEYWWEIGYSGKETPILQDSISSDNIIGDFNYTPQNKKRVLDFLETAQKSGFFSGTHDYDIYVNPSKTRVYIQQNKSENDDWLNLEILSKRDLMRSNNAKIVGESAVKLFNGLAEEGWVIPHPNKESLSVKITKSGFEVKIDIGGVLIELVRQINALTLEDDDHRIGITVNKVVTHQRLNKNRWCLGLIIISLMKRFDDTILNQIGCGQISLDFSKTNPPDQDFKDLVIRLLNSFPEKYNGRFRIAH